MSHALDQQCIVMCGAQALKLSGPSHTDALECMRFLPGGRLATKSADGAMNVWNIAARSHIASWKVSPTCNPPNIPYWAAYTPLLSAVGRMLPVTSPE